MLNQKKKHSTKVIILPQIEKSLFIRNSCNMEISTLTLLVILKEKGKIFVCFSFEHFLVLVINVDGGV